MSERDHGEQSSETSNEFTKKSCANTQHYYLQTSHRKSKSVISQAAQNVLCRSSLKFLSHWQFSSFPTLFLPSHRLNLKTSRSIEQQIDARIRHRETWHKQQIARSWFCVWVIKFINYDFLAYYSVCKSMMKWNSFSLCLCCLTHKLWNFAISEVKKKVEWMETCGRVIWLCLHSFLSLSILDKKEELFNIFHTHESTQWKDFFFHFIQHDQCE